MAKTAEEIVAALDASSEESETPTDEAKAETEEAKASEGKPEESSDEGKKGKGAQDRIQELVSARKGVEESLEKVQGELTERNSELGKLVDLLQQREYDSRVLAKINELHSNPKYTEMVESLDKAIQGLDTEEEATTDDKEVDKSVLKAREDLNQARDELAEEVANQKADQLLSQADQFISAYMEALDEEAEGQYNEADKRQLIRMLDDDINWEAIEEDPKQMGEVIRVAFEGAINEYGEPRGALVAKAQEETTTETETKAKEPDVASILNKQWGKLQKTGETKEGKPILSPVVSDEDFIAAAGEAYRRSKATGE